MKVDMRICLREYVNLPKPQVTLLHSAMQNYYASTILSICHFQFNKTGPFWMLKNIASTVDYVALSWHYKI